MIMIDQNLFGETYDPPQIKWEENERYAIIAFLLLFVDRKINAEDLKKIDIFMGITGTEMKNYEYDDHDKLRTARDTIVREGIAFLDSIGQDENRYDCISDEFDRVIDGNDHCEIGSGYTSLGVYYRCYNLEGTEYMLFEYLKLLVFDEKYNGDRKRLMQHLTRKWNIDKSILPILENAVKALDEINRKRIEVQNSAMPYSEAVSALAKVDIAEASIWNGLNTFDIRKNLSVSVEEDNAVYEEESLVDKIGDHIVEGIYKVGDLICAPFEWMTDKMIDLTCR